MKAPAARLLLLAALPFQALFAQATQSGAPAPGADRDQALEARAAARREEIIRFVQPKVKARVEGASRSMLERIRSGQPGDLVQYARSQVTVRMGKLKQNQADLLAFAILAEAAHTLAGGGKTDEALKVESDVDILQSATMREALHRDSALMTALRQLLSWTEREGAEILLEVKG